ncbi:unnamed protein product [Eruca vesicaria subsp. sativa]|uniref:HMA domain-containing protein n=1 Tax=Eruca vesicaria subsp. sativa TaxID=29727 RepID=A0ABC8L6G9_ERUVS|nr:unnamed protein product [Eruca vesicaria subsp. sativa]
MDDPVTKKLKSTPGTVDDVISILMPYVTDPKDRASASLVNPLWFKADSETREHVTIAFCYASSPHRLSRRFPNLRSLKLKGKPRAAMFNLVPENWGGFATPWVNEIALSLRRIRSVHFRRMIVSDLDLDVLARARGDELEVLKLDKCSGFSTDGILSVVKHCRKIKTLLMDESSIFEKDGKWLHELALHNTSLEVLNFYMTELTILSRQDLAMIARNCHRSLVSVKVGELEMLDLVGFFNAAVNLEEFFSGALNENVGDPDKYTNLTFPPKLCRLGLSYLGANQMPIVFPFAAQIRKLDLLYAFLGTDDHCKLIQKCPNLEVLETRRNVIGDKGLEALAQYCKRLKRLRIEREEYEQGMEDEGGLVTQRGLIALAQSCHELKYLAVYVTDITNESLETVGTHLKNLIDFRLVLLHQKKKITDLPLDNGVRSLLMGCKKLRRFALYLRQGGLTDVGLRYIGEYSQNVRWMRLGYVGETDQGLMEFARGCPKQLQKLEMKGCCFSERGIAAALMKLRSLRYLWVQVYGALVTGQDVRVMSRPYWNIELIPDRKIPQVDWMGEVRDVEQPAHILAYYSLAGQRTDCPPTVMSPEGAMMMFDDANQACVLKVDLNSCSGCPNNAKAKLLSLSGVTAVEYNEEEGLMTITGDVDPMTLVQKLTKCKKKAELVSVNYMPDVDLTSSDEEDEEDEDEDEDEDDTCSDDTCSNPDPRPMERASQVNTRPTNTIKKKEGMLRKYLMLGCLRRKPKVVEPFPLAKRMFGSTRFGNGTFDHGNARRPPPPTLNPLLQYQMMMQQGQPQFQMNGSVPPMHMNMIQQQQSQNTPYHWQIDPQYKAMFPQPQPLKPDPKMSANSGLHYSGK